MWGIGRRTLGLLAIGALGIVGLVVASNLTDGSDGSTSDRCDSGPAPGAGESNSIDTESPADTDGPSLDQARAAFEARFEVERAGLTAAFTGLDGITSVEGVRYEVADGVVVLEVTDGRCPDRIGTVAEIASLWTPEEGPFWDEGFVPDLEIRSDAGAMRCPGTLLSRVGDLSAPAADLETGCTAD